MEKNLNKYSYVILMKKWELSDFFKHGRLYARCPRVAFDGNIDNLCVDRVKAQSLFKSINPIESSLDAFLVHLSSAKPMSETLPIYLRDVIDIYALDEISYRVGLQFHPAVRLCKPLGGVIAEEFKLSKLRNVAISVLDGIDNVRDIFGLLDNKIFKDKKAKLIGGVEVLKRYVELAIACDQPCEEDNVWTYLLRYERHQNYPKKMRGYFLDMLHVLSDFVAKRVVDESVIMRDRQTFGDEHLAAGISALQDVDYSELLDICLKSKKCKEILKKELKVFVSAAPIFLMLEDVFRGGMDISLEYGGMRMLDFIERVNKRFSATPNYTEALYLLGLKLGWEGTRIVTYQTKISIVEK